MAEIHRPIVPSAATLGAGVVSLESELVWSVADSSRMSAKVWPRCFARQRLGRGSEAVGLLRLEVEQRRRGVLLNEGSVGVAISPRLGPSADFLPRQNQLHRASSHASLFGGQVRHGAKCPGDSAAAELVARTRSSHRRAPRRRATQSIPRCPRSTLRSPGASGSPPTRAKRNRSFEATTTLTAASEDPASRERTYSPPSQSLIDPRRPLAAGAVPSVVASTSAGAGSTNSCGTGPSWIWLGSPKSSWP